MAHQELVPNQQSSMLRILFCLFCVPWLNGCMTHALWTGELVELSHEPSFPNHLALFETSEHGEVLVQYDELSPWRTSEQRRTYFLRENLNRLKARKAPRFVEPEATNSSAPIPVIVDSERATDPDQAPPIYAITSIGENKFTIFRTNGVSEGPYQLPAYHSISGDLKVVLLTPITITVDAIAMSGFGLYWISYGVARIGHLVIYQSR